MHKRMTCEWRYVKGTHQKPLAKLGSGMSTVHSTHDRSSSSFLSPKQERESDDSIVNFDHQRLVHY